jgi:hypothetical protein
LQSGAYFQLVSNYPIGPLVSNDPQEYVQVYRCNGTAGQRFRMDRDGRLYSKLKSGLCVEMDSKYGIFVHSACIDQWEMFYDDMNPNYGPWIRNIGAGMCIGINEEFLLATTPGPDPISIPVKIDGCGGFNTPGSFDKVY